MPSAALSFIRYLLEFCSTNRHTPFRSTTRQLTMIIASFNVNSVRLRLHQIQALVDSINPDVIGLQETKVQDHEFPVEALREMGFYAEFQGQKTHYGVALLSKTPIDNPRKGFAGDTDEAQTRFIAGTVLSPKGNEVSVLNGYFPQGESRVHETKFPAKEKFYHDLNAHLQAHHSADDALAVIGDFNIAPNDNDLGIGPDNVKRWLRDGKASFLPEERQWFQTLCAWGLHDNWRQQHPDNNEWFSWFDYRSKGFDKEPKRGLRIDHILTTSTLSSKLTGCGIDYTIRAMDKPSDHCPVWSEFDF